LTSAESGTDTGWHYETGWHHTGSRNIEAAGSLIREHSLHTGYWLLLSRSPDGPTSIPYRVRNHNTSQARPAHPLTLPPDHCRDHCQKVATPFLVWSCRPSWVLAESRSNPRPRHDER